jgi:hypothetical protein
MLASSIEGDEGQEKYDIIDKVCLFFYTMEFFLKIIGQGVRNYFDDEWNK